MYTILIVDDEQETRELLKKKLEQSGYAAMIAASGKEALEIAKTNRPDLVLMDILMPDMNGYQVCLELKQREETRDVPIVFLTGKDIKGTEGILELYMMIDGLGGAGYIQKPATAEEIIEKIKTFLK